MNDGCLKAVARTMTPSLVGFTEADVTIYGPDGVAFPTHKVSVPDTRRHDALTFKLDGRSLTCTRGSE